MIHSHCHLISDKLQNFIICLFQFFLRFNILIFHGFQLPASLQMFLLLYLQLHIQSNLIMLLIIDFMFLVKQSLFVNILVFSIFCDIFNIFDISLLSK